MGALQYLIQTKKTINDWLMVLAIKEDVNIKHELESILGSKVVDESTNQSNKISTSKTEIISKQINSNNSIYFANDEDNLLISSNPNIIQSSIEKLDSNIINTKKNV